MLYLTIIVLKNVQMVIMKVKIHVKNVTNYVKNREKIVIVVQAALMVII